MMRMFPCMLSWIVGTFWVGHSAFGLLAPTRAPHSYQQRESRLFISTPTNGDPAQQETTSNDNKLRGLNVAVVGGGPSGLLLAHRLVDAGASAVQVLEQRSFPSETLSSRAYALGVGRRGRTAIQSSGSLWKAVQQVGYASQRFILHAGPFQIRLRDENDDGNDGVGNIEPSLLLYQSDLCRAMAQELQTKDRVTCHFDCTVTALDLNTQTVSYTTNTASDENGRASTTTTTSFDLVVGCDGVNSIVRKTMGTTWPDFASTQDLLPGGFKVVQLDRVPSNLDPTAVQLFLPKSGKSTAFVEPTQKGQCCLLFATSSTDGDLLLTSTNVTQVQEELLVRFPNLWGDDDNDNDELRSKAAQQLASTTTVGQASVVTCNIYHYRNRAALCGDACHATGGVSGQGVNSALVDATRLADCLESMYQPDHKDSSLQQALLTYSQLSVPEGKALYDLSFGPKPTSPLVKFQFALKSALDLLFKGKFGIGELPLQTLLTTSLQSFAEIRKARDEYYQEPFPEGSHWNATLAELDATARS